PVPGWFGMENQGAGIAIADIRGSRQLDLVVAHIDNPARENRGYYRIGWHLDATGSVSGDWTDPIQIPGWFGSESQGAGIAVTDISRNGLPDLVMFHIDNAFRANRSYYRIGWDLDRQGIAARWSDPILLPGPFADETRGGGIAIADVDGNGRPDLIVFWLNRVPGGNRGYYRIGWNLDQNGQVTGGWSTPVQVPDTFGDDNQGADIAVADLTGSGRLDLVLFYLVRSGGTLNSYVRIGYGLNVSGQITEGWSTPLQTATPHGGAAQGAGVAVADIGRSRQSTQNSESTGLVNLLDAFRTIWRGARDGTHVPHVGRAGSDPDGELVRMLGMEALSSQYQGRSLLGPYYTCALWFFLGNPWFPDPNPNWGSSWWEQHRQMAEHALQALRLQLPHQTRLLHASFAADSFPVEGPLVHHGPPSESTPLSDTANYITWLRQAHPKEIHAQAGVPSEVSRDELLYRLLRHATLWAYADAAFRLRPLWPGNPIEARRREREPELVDLEALHTPDSPSRSWTPWRYLIEPQHGQILANDLHQNPAQDHLLTDFLRSLDWLKDQPTAALERLCAESLDLGSHRLDAWITACATQRLWQMRQVPEAAVGLQLGGYGWVEKLHRKDDGGSASAGYIHAPSLAHATTAAILQSGYLSHQGSNTGDLLALDLSSERVRLALWLLDGVRQGQPLGALLGYRFERMLHDLHLDKYIATFRELYPLAARKLVPATEPVEAIAANNVVDGYKLLEQWQKKKVPFGESRTDGLVSLPSNGEEYNKLRQALAALEQVADAASDAVIAESVYQVVQGNPLRAGASLDAIARGEAPAPELEVARSARSGIALTHRIVTLFSGEAATPDHDEWPTNQWQARANAEPHLNAWAARLLPQPSKVRYWAEYEYLDPESGTLLRTRDDLSLQDLELSPLDILYTALPDEVTLEELDPTMSAPQETPPGDEMQRSELAQRMVYHLLREPPSGVPTDARVRLRFTRRPGWSAEALTLPEFLEIVRAARDLITGGRALDARDLAPPAQGGVEPATDLEELKKRAYVAEQEQLQTAHDALEALLKEARLQLAALPEMSSEMQQDLRRVPAALWEQVVFSEEQWEAVHESLLRLAYLGLDGAIPVSAAKMPDRAAQVRLLQQVVTIVIEANRRLNHIEVARKRWQSILNHP
ncbi:MAG: VCBS repeat-containing protein, partial [Chloroflexota bacterium]|nr:VCBS repeat-containing protein [Chloroflexota bacterium]